MRSVEVAFSERNHLDQQTTTDVVVPALFDKGAADNFSSHFITQQNSNDGEI
jgi:hypothetical protein